MSQNEQLPSRTQRSEYGRRFSTLDSQASSWRGHWADIANNVAPRRFVFGEDSVNQGTKMNTRIINSTATLAIRTSSGGMMTNMSSPSSPWFELSPPLGTKWEDDRDTVSWCEEATDGVRSIFSGSNFYDGLPDVYEDDLSYGTNLFMIEEDDDEVIRSVSAILGTYFLICDKRGRVCGAYRWVAYTVAQLVDEFGLSRVTSSTRERYRSGHLDQTVIVRHVIEPNTDRQPNAIGPAGMRWRSVWYERAAVEADGFLRVSGYNENPVIGSRWSVRPGDTYGRSPTMDCLGDIKALQQEEMRKAEAIDKMLRPPTAGPQSLQQVGVSLIPGAVNYLPNGAVGKLEPVLTVHPSAVAEIKASSVERALRIRQTLYADVWALFTQDERNREATAEEIRAKKEERLLLLGAPVGRFNREIFAPAVGRTLAIAIRKNLIPKPPRRFAEESNGYDIVYTSVLHQALKAVGIAGIERTVSFVGSLAAVVPSAPKKLNWGRVVEGHARATGMPTAMVKSDQEVEQETQKEMRQALAMEGAKADMQARAKGMMPAAAAPASVDPAAAAVLAGADAGQPGTTNTLLNALGPLAAGGGFPGVQGAG